MSSGPTGRRARRRSAGLRACLAGALLLTSCADEQARDPAPPAGSTETRTPDEQDRSGDRCIPPEDGAVGLLAEARRRGHLRIGISGEEPYGFLTATGAVTGQGPELARQVLCRLGVPDVEARIVDFGALIAALDTGRFDVIAAGMFITPARAQKVLFTQPYFCEGTALAVRQGNPLALRDLSSVAQSGVRLGVLRGAVEQRYALAAGVPAQRTAQFEAPTDLFAALRAGHVDAVALSAATVQNQTEGSPSLASTPPFLPIVEGVEQMGCGAFAFRLTDTELHRRFDETLQTMMREKQVLPVLAPFGFDAASVERAEQVRPAELVEAQVEAGVS